MSDQPKEASLNTIDLAGTAERQAARPIPGNGDTQTSDNQPVPLLTEDDIVEFRSHWNSIQAGFVDEPHTSVVKADSLVADVMEHIAETFAVQRNMLEDRWNHDDNVSTEDLRVALQRYRSFFNRLLSL
jgi:hypothetical protein